MPLVPGGEMQFNEPDLWKGHKPSMHFQCILKKQENMKHCQAVICLYPPMLHGGIGAAHVH